VPLQSLPVLCPPIPRVREPEPMDDPTLAASDHLRALVALGTINTLSLTTARLADRKTVADVPLTGLSSGFGFKPLYRGQRESRKSCKIAAQPAHTGVPNAAPAPPRLVDI
jgi:hypothetical protein